MAENLYLFADNNEGVAENLGSYRLYDMKIEGDSEGVESGVDYVDYLIGDGNSYIDTGLYTKSNTKVEIRLSNISFINSKHFFGSDKFVLGFQTSKGNWVFFKHGSEGILNYMDSYTDNDEITSITMDMNDNQYVVDINNNKVEDSDYKYISNLDSSKTLKIFTSHYKGYGTSFDDNIQNRISIFNLYSFKVYEGDNLVQDLKPCLDTQGVPCMYDEISKQYFYNQGTGTFGYKKTLRDYQPVLDSNNIPCLLDKKNMKYYYNKGTGVFDTKEKIKYKKLKYIQGDLNSYINTGLMPKNLIGYDVEVKFQPSTGYINMIFGVLNKNNISNTSTTFGLYTQGEYNYSSNFENKTSKTEGVLKTYTLTNAQENSLEVPIYLFAGNIINTGEVGTPYYLSDISIYYFKVFDTDDNLVMHLIPAMSTNNEIGMYDLISEQFFYNQGEGTFGYEIEELEVNDYTEIEYIESTGTQYIDTEVIPTTNTDIEMTCRACDYNESPTINNSYILNGLAINSNTYQYNDTDTTVQPNLVASEGATLTMGTANLNKLDEEDIEVATNNGWSLV